MVHRFYPLMLVALMPLLIKAEEQPIKHEEQEVRSATPTASSKREDPKTHGKVACFAADCLQNTKASDEAYRKAYNQCIMQSPLPVVVKFYMKGCGQCLAIKGALEQLANDYAGRVRFIEIDAADEFKDLANHNKVKALPTLIYIDNGEEQGRDTGPQTINTLRNHVKEYFKL